MCLVVVSWKEPEYNAAPAGHGGPGCRGREASEAALPGLSFRCSADTEL